jgi:hypothetical protein
VTGHDRATLRIGLHEGIRPVDHRLVDSRRRRVIEVDDQEFKAAGLEQLVVVAVVRRRKAAAEIRLSGPSIGTEELVPFRIRRVDLPVRGLVVVARRATPRNPI